MKPRLAARRGGVTVLVAATLTALLGAAAWVVDLSAGMHVRTRQQMAADAGALAAAFHLLPPTGASVPDEVLVRSAARGWVQRNGFSIGDSAVTIWRNPALGNPTPSGGVPKFVRDTVVVGWDQPVPTSFASIFGIDDFQVGAKAAATLGGPTEIPMGFLPFGVPAYQDDNKQWWALGSPTPGDYRLLTPNPATQLILKVKSQSQQTGNFLALSLDAGTGADNYRHNIVNGTNRAYEYGETVWTQTGNMAGPTRQGIQDRLALYRGAKVLVPLIKREEWETNNGTSPVTLIGFIAATISSVSGGGEIYATFETRVIPVKGSTAVNNSPGVFAPVLVMAPV